MNALIEVKIPDEVIAVVDGVEKALEAVRTYPVPTSVAEYEAAGELLKINKAKAKWLEEQRVDLKKEPLESCRKIDRLFDKPKQQCKEYEQAIKGAMLTYDRQQEELRKEAERKAAEAARREQDRLRAEAAKAEAVAREKREAEEARARVAREKEETKARAAEEAGRAEEAARRRAAADEAERVRMEQAAETERQRLQAAEASRLAAETMPTAPVVHMASPKVAGVSTREVWSAEVTDKLALIQAVAAGEAPAELLEVSMVTANKLAKALKGGMNYAGLKAVCTQQMAARA